MFGNRPCRSFLFLRYYRYQQGFWFARLGHKFLDRHDSLIVYAGAIANFDLQIRGCDDTVEHKSITFKISSSYESAGKITSEDIAPVDPFPRIPADDQQTFKIAGRALRVEAIDNRISAGPISLVYVPLLTAPFP